MELDKEIARQIKRVETLQKEVFGRKQSADDIKRPDDLRAERAQTLHRAITDLRKRRELVNARLDAEIESYEAELKAVEARTEFDLGGTGFGKGKTPSGNLSGEVRKPVSGKTRNTDKS